MSRVVVVTPLGEDGELTEELLTTAEVAQLFRVDPKTVGRWARSGKLAFVRTVGGQRRYRKADLMPYLKPAMPEPGGKDGQRTG